MPSKLMVVLKAISIPFLMLGSFLFYKIFPKVKKDNKIEEMVEEVVKITSGVEIDLTPEYILEEEESLNIDNI